MSNRRSERKNSHILEVVLYQLITLKIDRSVYLNIVFLVIYSGLWVKYSELIIIDY